MAPQRDESQLCLPNACPSEYGLERRAARIMSEGELAVLAHEALKLIPEMFAELVEAVELLSPGPRRAGLLRRIQKMIASLK